MPYTARQWLDFGPAELTWNSVVLGKTVANPDGGMHGGLRLQVSTQTAEVMRDAQGKYDEIIVRQVFAIQANLTGLSIEQMSKIIPGAALSAGPTDKQMTFGNAVGTSARGSAQAMIIKPILNGVTSVTAAQWLNLTKTYPKPEIDLAFSVDNQKIWAVTFGVYPDDSGNYGTLGVNAA